MSVVKELALFGNLWQNNSINLSGSIEQVSSPACPGSGPRYMLSHISSKSPNVIELG